MTRVETRERCEEGTAAQDTRRPVARSVARFSVQILD